MKPPFFFSLLLLCSATAVTFATPDVRPLEDLPIQHGGRKKPFLTFAKETLLGIHGATTFKDEGRKLSAAQTMASLWFAPEGWEHKPLIRVTLKSFRQNVGLDRERKYFSFQELVGNPAVLAATDAVRQKRRADRDAKLSADEREADELAVRLAVFQTLREGSAFTVVPREIAQNGGDPKASGGNPTLWASVQSLKGEVGQSGPAVAAIVEAWESAKKAWVSSADAFPGAAKRFAATLRQASSGADYPSAQVMALEHLYTTMQPHRIAWMVYAAAAAVLIFTAKSPRSRAYALGWGLMIAGFALQAFGFYCRVAIAGRPPVTNMYETVIWVGFGVVLFAIILEAFHRNRYFLVAAAVAAMLSLFVADTQPVILDPTINPLMPVLRDNFWLATHVITVVSSYAAFLLALALGHIAVFKVLFGRSTEAAKPLYQPVYRAIQIGVLLLAVGVVLGAFWANYSWGRFWDWDPKETWALVALLSYLFILHGRIAGWWSGFGLSIGAILGFQTVLMAWYGVNFILGTGLHSYGFGSGGVSYAVGFVIFEVVLVGIAILKASRMKRPLIDAPPSRKKPEEVLV